MPQPGWPSRLTLFIAGEIRRRRDDQDISAQQLADTCTELGVSISRATLTDLENGRRATLSVAELLVIAKALDIGPLQLIAPVDRGRLELLPDQDMDPWSARRWITSEGTPQMDVLHRYVQCERRLQGSLGEYGRAKRDRFGLDPDIMRQQAEDRLHELLQLRGAMVNDGWELPDIPADLKQQLKEMNINTEGRDADEQG